MTEAEFRALETQYRGLLYTEVRRWMAIDRARRNADDLRQEARIGLWRAALKYSKEKSNGKTFGSYARLWIRSQLSSAVRKMCPVSISSKRGGVVASLHVASLQLDGQDLPGDDETQGRQELAYDAKSIESKVKTLLFEKRRAQLGAIHNHVYTDRVARRDTDIMVERLKGAETFSRAGKKHGISRERARLITVQMAPLVESVKAKL